MALSGRSSIPTSFKLRAVLGSALLGGFVLSGLLLSGCGPAVFYDEVPDNYRGPGFSESVREVILVPPERLIGSDATVCNEDLNGLHAQISQAIEISISHHDWQTQQCLSDKSRVVGTVYHAQLGSPLRDEYGRPLALRTQCIAPKMAREARACAGT